MFKKTTFKNGLRAIAVPQKSTKAATVLILVGTGSKYEKKEINGISHFLEHMLFKGTKKRPSPIEVAQDLDRVGGVFNAFTGEEYTGYFAKVEASKIELALDWTSDIFLNSTLPSAEVKKERGVVIEEINMQKDHPMSHLQFLWPRLLYGDQPAGRSILGPKKNILKMGRKELFDYRKKQYVAQNSLVCMAGNFSPRQGMKSLGKYFSGISTSFPYYRKPRIVEKQKEPGLLLEERKTDQAHFSLGARAYSLFHPGRYALEIMASILGGMMSSRLFVELREKLGLCYYIRTNAEMDPDTGSLLTSAGVDKKNVGKAISVILKEYKRMAEKRLSAEELKKAKDNIKGKMALSLESSDSLAGFYAMQELLEKRILTQGEIYRLIDRVSGRDIQEAAKDIFKPKGLNLALLGPFKKAELFKKLLKFR